MKSNIFIQNIIDLNGRLHPILSIPLITMIIVSIGCGGCGGVKKPQSTLDKSKDSIGQNSVSVATSPKFISDFSWKQNGENYILKFSEGKEVNTKDYIPILSQIPKKAINFHYSVGEKSYYYRIAKIDFTKIDHKTKLALTKNMHFEFPIDVDSLLYADYRLDFPDDTTVVLPNRPRISESLTLYGRCWKNCHEEELGMEIIIGSMGYMAYIDNQGNKLADFYDDKFGQGQISRDLKYYGGGVGGHYSDGGGFYRRGHIYFYEISNRELIFYKLMPLKKGKKVDYDPDFEMFNISFQDEAELIYYLNPKNKTIYKIKFGEDLKSKYLRHDKYGYYFKDGTSLLFDRDFDKISFETFSTPYTSYSKN